MIAAQVLIVSCVVGAIIIELHDFLSVRIHRGKPLTAVLCGLCGGCGVFPIKAGIHVRQRRAELRGHRFRHELGQASDTPLQIHRPRRFRSA